MKPSCWIMAAVIAGTWFGASIRIAAAPLEDLNATTAPTPPPASSSPRDKLNLDAIFPDTSAANSPETAGVAEVEFAKQALLAGDVAKCQDQLRAAYATRPNLPPPTLMLARLMLALGKVDVGRQLLEDGAVAHPQHPQLYVLFGQLALFEGHITDAALHFEKALASPVPEIWDERQRQYLKAECVAGKTAVAERRGDWAAAAQLYQERASADAQNAALRDRWAMALFRAGKLEQALEQFDIAYRQDNTLNRPEVSMAVMSVAEGKYRQADRWFADALKAYPDEPAVHYERTIALLYEDRADEAEKVAERAARLGFDSPALDAHRGAVALQQGNFPRAEEFLRASLRKSPDNVSSQRLLAVALVQQQDKVKQTQALKLAQAVVKVQPENPTALSTLGWVLFRTGDGAAGETLLRRAAAAHFDPTAHFFLARVLVERGKVEEGRAIAKQLESQIDEPGLFIFRPEARKWLASALATGNSPLIFMKERVSR